MHIYEQAVFHRVAVKLGHTIMLTCRHNFINILFLTNNCAPVSYTHLTLPTNREV